eukprot:SAG11_NODE_11610_length_749_cov_1.041538_2_plen_111_part_01
MQTRAAKSPHLPPAWLPLRSAHSVCLCHAAPTGQGWAVLDGPDAHHTRRAHRCSAARWDHAHSAREPDVDEGDHDAGGATGYGADGATRLFNTRSPRYLRALVPRGFAVVS